MLCNATVVIEYDRRRSGLPDAPLDVEYDNSITEQTITLNMQHNSYIYIFRHRLSTYSLYSRIHIFTYSRVHIFTCSHIHVFTVFTILTGTYIRTTPLSLGNQPLFSYAVVLHFQ